MLIIQLKELASSTYAQQRMASKASGVLMENADFFIKYLP
jgi:hypothetical protein